MNCLCIIASGFLTYSLVGHRNVLTHVVLDTTDDY